MDSVKLLLVDDEAEVHMDTSDVRPALNTTYTFWYMPSVEVMVVLSCSLRNWDMQMKLSWKSPAWSWSIDCSRCWRRSSLPWPQVEAKLWDTQSELKRSRVFAIFATSWHVLLISDLRPHGWRHAPYIHTSACRSSPDLKTLDSDKNSTMNYFERLMYVRGWHGRRCQFHAQNQGLWWLDTALYSCLCPRDRAVHVCKGQLKSSAFTSS